MKRPVLKTLPLDIQRDWRATLHPASGDDAGAYVLTGVRRTKSGSHEELRLIATVIDEDERPIDGLDVVFSYSTARQFLLDDTFTWLPPSQNGDIVPTTGGRAEHIQGSVVRSGQPGGVTVFVLDPSYPSVYVSGAGALADHTGLHLTFQLQRRDYLTVEERLASLEERVRALEG